MAAARTPPEQEVVATNNRRHIPAVIVEEILLNLPVKSLVRFSCVSKSWNSMISESGFVRKHHRRAVALPGHERIVVKAFRRDYLDTASFCSPSSMSSDTPAGDATAVVCPINMYPYLLASCEELWCVAASDSLYLWNPTMNTYRKLPDPSLPQQMRILDFVYGVGYDPVGDDYKIMKIPDKYSRISTPETELYSLTHNSWRKIQPFPGFPGKKGVFVNRALHWLAYPRDSSSSSSLVIVAFDLSTEECGEFGLPRYSPAKDFARAAFVQRSDREERLEVTVLRRMLCVYLNYYGHGMFVLWVMQDYGDDTSWTKMFTIGYGRSIPNFSSGIHGFSFKNRREQVFTLRPLYFYDNGGILVKVSTEMSSEIYMYENEEAMPRKIVGRGRCNKIADGFVHVDSLISPAAWPEAAPEVGKNG